MLVLVKGCPSPCRHRAGDVLMVRPQNLPTAVDEFLCALGLDPSQGLLVHATDHGGPCFRLHQSFGLNMHSHAPPCSYAPPTDPAQHLHC